MFASFRQFQHGLAQKKNWTGPIMRTNTPNGLAWTNMWNVDSDGVSMPAKPSCWVIWQEVGAEIAAKLSVRFPSSKQVIEFLRAKGKGQKGYE